MFRIDKVPGETEIFSDELQTYMKTKDGKEQAIPCCCRWVCGAAYLARCFGLSVQRIYQLRDLGVLCPEDEKDQGEQVFNLRLALRDFVEFKKHGRDGDFSNGPIKKGVHFGHLYDYDDELTNMILDINN